MGKDGGDSKGAARGRLTRDGQGEGSREEIRGRGPDGHPAPEPRLCTIAFDQAGGQDRARAAQGRGPWPRCCISSAPFDRPRGRPPARRPALAGPPSRARQRSGANDLAKFRVMRIADAMIRSELTAGRRNRGRGVVAGRRASSRILGLTAAGPVRSDRRGNRAARRGRMLARAPIAGARRTKKVQPQRRWAVASARQCRHDRRQARQPARGWRGTREASGRDHPGPSTAPLTCAAGMPRLGQRPPK